MKKLLLSILILGTGAIVSARLNQQTSRALALTSQRRADCAQLTNRLEELTTATTTLRAQLQEQRSRLNNAPPPPVSDTKLLEFLSKSQSPARRGGASPELRQQLGIAWDNSPDYILVSKAALRSIWFPGVGSRGVLSPTLCDILALTPQDRTAIDTALERAEAAHAAWFKTAVQRIAPSGDIVAEYHVPANPELVKRLEEAGMAALAQSLGQERADLVRNFAGVWLAEHGELGQFGIRFTVHQTPGQQPPFWYQTEEIGGSSGAGEVRPNSFPDLFRGAFPGGWRELAQREGFALPEEFNSPAAPEPPNP